MGSPKLQIIFHKRAAKYRSLLQKMTDKDRDPMSLRHPVLYIYVCVHIYCMYNGFICIVSSRDTCISSVGCYVHVSDGCMCTSRAEYSYAHVSSRVSRVCFGVCARLEQSVATRTSGVECVYRVQLHTLACVHALACLGLNAATCTSRIGRTNVRSRVALLRVPSRAGCSYAYSRLLSFGRLRLHTSPNIRIFPQMSPTCPQKRPTCPHLTNRRDLCAYELFTKKPVPPHLTNSPELSINEPYISAQEA